MERSNFRNPYRQNDPAIAMVSGALAGGLGFDLLGALAGGLLGLVVGIASMKRARIRSRSLVEPGYSRTER